MSMPAAVMDHASMESKNFARTEELLKRWGRECEAGNQALGLPTMSNIAQMVAHVQAMQDDKKARRKQRKRILRAARKAWKEGDPPLDAKLVAEDLGYTDQECTARGKGSPPTAIPGLQLSGTSATIDAIVTDLPGWAKKCIFRSYLYNQPDRRAALQLRMPRGEYLNRRLAAVELVALKLAERYSAGVSGHLGDAYR